MGNWTSVKEKLPEPNVLVKVKLANGVEALDFVNEPIDKDMPFQHYYDVSAWRKPARDELNDFMRRANNK